MAQYVPSRTQSLGRGTQIEALWFSNLKQLSFRHKTWAAGLRRPFMASKYSTSFNGTLAYAARLTRKNMAFLLIMMAHWLMTALSTN
jgi:hypothetical protein